MKVQVCETASKLSGVKKGGKVTKAKDSEECEIASYLDTLKHLLPSETNNRKQSRLDIIQKVIYYIEDLQDVLEGDKQTMDLLEYSTKSITLAA